MLILSRKIGEAVVLDSDITVRVMDISKGVVRLGFDAPKETLILRQELKEEIKQANIEAKNSIQDISSLRDLTRKIKKV